MSFLKLHITAIALLGISVLLLYVFYAIFIRHRFSPHRHLPLASQRPIIFRLFNDPTPVECAAWILNLPNDGLIRYFGFMNEEKILLTNTDAVRRVLLRETYTYNKIHALAAIQYPAGGTGLTSLKGDPHKMHRKHTIAAFRGSVTQKLYPTIWQSTNRCTNVLSKKLSRAASKTIKINTYMQAACLDTSGPANFGLEFEVFSKPEESLTKDYLRTFLIGERVPFLLKLLYILPDWLQHFGAIVVAKFFFHIDLSLMEAHIRKTLRTKLEAFESQKKHARNEKSDSDEERKIPSVLDELVWTANGQLSENMLCQHAMTILAASVEMVSNELSWAIYALAHPMRHHIQEKLHREIRTRYPRPPETITIEDIKSMPYLLGVTNEILRLYPGVAQRSRVCSNPTSILGHSIPKGTVVTWPIYGANRNPEYWGDDADVFRPERWFESGQRDTYAFMTFGQGPRKCPGEHYTRAVVACQLLSMFGRFKIGVPEGGIDVMPNSGDKRVGFGIVMKAAIYLEFEERDGWEVLTELGN